MIGRLLDRLAPRRPARSSDTGYRRLLRWAALPVTDRRWAGPLAAVALGFGLFAGVAIGPGAAGTFAGGVPQIIQIPGLIGGGDEGGEAAEEDEGPVSVEAPPPAEESQGEGEAGAFAPVVTETGFEAPEGEAETPATAGPGQEEETPAPEEEELSGTVIHVNRVAGSYTVAETGGVMSAVHAGKLPRAGTRIEVPIETLANGTLGEAGKRVKTGERTRATLAGIVTWVDPSPTEPAYTVSNRGSSVLIHVHPDPSGAPPTLPTLGAYTSVAVEIETKAPPASSSSAVARASASAEPPAAEPPASEQPETEPAPTEPSPPEAAPTPPAAPAQASPPAPACAPDPNRPPATAQPRSLLWQRQASGGGAPFTHGDLAGTVTATCPATAQLLVSADDIRESGHDLTIAVPTSFDLSKLAAGESILAAADIAAEGALTLTGLASDGHRKGADDAQATQGDLRPQKRN